jgi:hypothetical protein
MFFSASFSTFFAELLSFVLFEGYFFPDEPTSRSRESGLPFDHAEVLF